MNKIIKSIGLMSLMLVLPFAGYGNNLAIAASPVLTSVTITPATPTIMVGNTIQLTAVPKDQNGIAFTGATTMFASGNPAVATVNNVTGMVTGISTGMAAIIATSISGSTAVAGVSTVTVSTTLSQNKPPIISGITAPTVLETGEVGTWKIKASDPQNGSLSYMVDWGDATIQPLTKSAFVQTTTFTHSYLKPGDYTVTFTVSNDAGKSTTSTVTVHIIPETTPSTAPVITSLTGPTTIGVGEIETVTINAFDPKNSVLSYSADWGDTSTSLSKLIQPPFVQTATFSHVYNSPGTYTAVFVVENENGEQDSSSMKITVVNNNVSKNNISNTSDDDDDEQEDKDDDTDKSNSKNVGLLNSNNNEDKHGDEDILNINAFASNEDKHEDEDKKDEDRKKEKYDGEKITLKDNNKDDNNRELNDD